MTVTGIVAGYDGSADADQAVVWAAREAEVRRRPLTVCLAQQSPNQAVPADRAGPAGSVGATEPAEPAQHAEPCEHELRTSQDVLAPRPPGRLRPDRSQSTRANPTGVGSRRCSWP